MADDIIDQLLSHRGGQDEACAKKLCLLCQAADLILAQEDEIERLRAAGDALAAAVNDDHRPMYCEMGCPSRTAVEAWEEARRG